MHAAKLKYFVADVVAEGRFFTIPIHLIYIGIVEKWIKMGFSINKLNISNPVRTAIRLKIA
jgi:hypothetical protein